MSTYRMHGLVTKTVRSFAAEKQPVCSICGQNEAAQYNDKCLRCQGVFSEIGAAMSGADWYERALEATRARVAEESAVKLVARCEAGLCDSCAAHAMCAEDADAARDWAADWADQSQPWMA